MKRALPWLVLTSLVVAFSSFAQDDDDLAPVMKKPKPPVAKPKPKPAPKPAPKAKIDDDDLVAPVAAKGDLLIKLPQKLENAVVWVDGRELGPFPVAAQSLTAGEHTLKVRRVGFADFTKKVVVPAGKSIEVEAKLVATHAVISVASDIPDAQVFLNGKPVGVVPLKDLEVGPGAVEIVVRKEGYKEDKRSMTLVAGKDSVVSVKLAPTAAATTTLVATNDRPVETKLTPDEGIAPIDTGVTKPVEDAPIYGRWYFWAGIAAVAVGAAVATGVAVNNSQPPQRLDEKTVCAVSGGRCDICVGLQCTSAFRFPFTGR